MADNTIVRYSGTWALNSGSGGHGGELVVEAPRVELTAGGAISANARGAGDGRQLLERAGAADWIGFFCV